LQDRTLKQKRFVMQCSKISTTPCFCLLAALAIMTVGCGSMNSMSNRVLQSMVITPANADAQTSPNGQVQFSAMGTFSKAPSPAPVPCAVPFTGTWFSSDTNIATITQAGLAECVSVAAGTVTISATASTNSGTGTMSASTSVSATAKLTCP
jgi:hypothetical protein